MTELQRLHGEAIRVLGTWRGRVTGIDFPVLTDGGLWQAQVKRSEFVVRAYGVTPEEALELLIDRIRESPYPPPSTFDDQARSRELVRIDKVLLDHGLSSEEAMELSEQIWLEMHPGWDHDEEYNVALREVQPTPRSKGA